MVCESICPLKAVWLILFNYVYIFTEVPGFIARGVYLNQMHYSKPSVLGLNSGLEKLIRSLSMASASYCRMSKNFEFCHS